MSTRFLCKLSIDTSETETYHLIAVLNWPKDYYFFSHPKCKAQDYRHTCFSASLMSGGKHYFQPQASHKEPVWLSFQVSREVMSVFDLLSGLLQSFTAVVTGYWHLQPTEFRPIQKSSEKASDNVRGFLQHFILNFSSSHSDNLGFRIILLML